MLKIYTSLQRHNRKVRRKCFFLYRESNLIYNKRVVDFGMVVVVVVVM